MEFPVFVFGFVIIIVAISKYTAYQKLKLTMSQQRNQAAHDDLHHELDAIKERLKVLERIVTDKNYSLQEEFERLKNRP